MFRKILVPVDGSEQAIAAVKYARNIAEKFNSAITLIHIIRHPAYLISGSHPLLMKNMDERGNQILSQAIEIFQDFDGLITTRIEYGHPGVKITEISKENNFSLIIMGRRGMSDVTKLLLGSVSNYVLHYASCPTLIVHNDD
ncbi:universal stress protein [Pectinatus frisingensis]|uniref:universal stress protein n=1 Tax=Pectinatus frisingensis TaxID=865 RepID=UPI0018C6B99B|nr:universal stress protein [Pectinatus frisingensis]